MNANIKSITIQNFKGCKSKTYKFDGKNATVSGANATGKTTIVDAFWWCLFNKDSLGSEKFSIRPLDADGKQVDNVEIKVSVVLDIDGREKEFTKTQKQKWVKKRGSDVAELQGNENLYEIDGYPKAEKDYKASISEIVSEDVFKMITNPTYFPSLKWKEQREILMRFVTDVSDYELASGKPEFAGLLDELQKAPSTDDIKAKYQKALTEWKKKQAEIPVRIDEAEKSKVDIDVAELELQRNALKEQMAEVKAKQDDVSKQTEEYQKLSDGILELKFAEGDLQRKANVELFKKRRELDDKITDLKYGINGYVRDIAIAEKEIEKAKTNIECSEMELKTVRDLWKSTNAMQFDKDEEVCQMCGQRLPHDRIEVLQSEFEQRKSDTLADITSRGNRLKDLVETEKDRLEKLENGLHENICSRDNAEKEFADLEKQLSELPTSINISDTEEYKAIKSQIAEKEEALAKMNNVGGIRESLEAELEDLHVESVEVERKISLAQKNVEIDERISKLQAEQKEVAQKVADQEKMLYLLEQFIRYKMDSVSESINSKFDGINFKLFDLQLNGGLKETCELTVNGVPYSSLNNGHRIIAGLQIIKALQGLYDVRMPIFTDNAESINSFNFPKMGCQMIYLSVSESKELVVGQIE